MVTAKGFLRDKSAMAAAETFGEELQEALGEVMGCGGQIDSDHLASIGRALQTMWHTLPKNTKGKADWRSLRYMTHRYFMQQSSLMIRGFEPFREVNMSDTGILSKQIPQYVDRMLGGKHAQEGFSLQDATYLVATLEQVIFDSETHLLEKVYDSLRIAPKTTLSFDRIKSIMEAYMVHWMMGDDSQSINILMRNRTLLESAFPHWQNLKEFVGGRIKTLDLQRMRKPASGESGKTLAQQYSFDDAHKVVGGITKTFQSYWESECDTMKEQLVAMDKKGTGRVHLADFYGTGMDKDWRFGESEQYLREMGVLDESNMWYGKQVMISNYLQASSNCIVTTSHYMVCCGNPCEGILGDIETEVGSAMASPSQIFEIVGNMTTEDDDHILLSPALVDQLQRVADQQGGKVPLHARLFSQWLHYVFPHECTFPHKAGSVSMASPLEFGDYVASKQDMKKQVREEKTKRAQGQQNETDVETFVMSQWSEEEELFADYSVELKAPWASRQPLAIGGVLMLVIVALFGSFSRYGRHAAVSMELPLGGHASSKSHWV